MVVAAPALAKQSSRHLGKYSTMLTQTLIQLLLNLFLLLRVPPRLVVPGVHQYPEYLHELLLKRLATGRRSWRGVVSRL